LQKATVPALSTVLACFFIATTLTEARVFLRWGRQTDAASVVRALGGETAYQAPVTINGIPGNLAVFSFSEPMQQCMQRILAVLQPGTSAPRDAALSTTFTRENEHLRLLAFSDGEGTAARTILFLTSIPADQQDAAQKPPDTYPAKAIPVFPGSRLLFSASNHETDSHFVFAECDSTPETITGFMATRFTAGQWVPLSPPAGTGNFTIYGRANELCCVYVGKAEGAAPIPLGILYKRLGSDKTP
jgi:hypothetical protein